MREREHAPAGGCPSWCVLRHDGLEEEFDGLHVSAALMVRGKLLRLYVDRAGGAQRGPYLLLGNEEYTLHEADVLIGALTQLVDEGLEGSKPMDA